MDKPLRLKHYDPSKPRRKMTPAQTAAHRRTWNIIQLRSQWVNSFWVRTRWRRVLVRWLIDSELRRLKAEPHGKRVKRQKAEMDAEEVEWQRNRSEPIPF